MAHIVTLRHDMNKSLCKDDPYTSIFFASRRERRLRCAEPRDGSPEWRTGDVIQARLVAEADGIRIAAMLAANPKLQLGPALPAPLDRDLDQFAHAFAIDADKGIAFDQPAREIFAEETAGVVARDAKGGLCQIVRAEAEELSSLGDFLGHQGRARQLDHGADH